MKLAALQLMQQKASKQESPTSLENGNSSSPTSSFPENGIGDSEKPPLEDGKLEDGRLEDGVAGLDQVKELTETIASDDGAGMSHSGPKAKSHSFFLKNGLGTSN